MKNKFIYFLLFLLIIFIISSYVFINQKESIAIIGAMDVEIEEILDNLANKSYKNNADFHVITGSLGKYKIILSKSGVGKVASATTTQYIIDKYKPKYIINIGISGSLSPSLKTGDIIIAEKMIQHDFDVTAFGHPKGYMDNGIEPNKPTIYYSDKKLIEKFNKNNYIKPVTIATGDIFITDVKLKKRKKKDFSASAIDMESAAIAQTAKRNNTPLIVLRIISDGLKGNTSEYMQNKERSAYNAASITLKILECDK